MKCKECGYELQPDGLMFVNGTPSYQICPKCWVLEFCRLFREMEKPHETTYTQTRLGNKSFGGRMKCEVCGKETNGTYNGWPVCMDCYDNNSEAVLAHDLEMEKQHEVDKHSTNKENEVPKNYPTISNNP